MDFVNYTIIVNSEFKESRRMTARCHHGHDVDRSETSPNVSRTENSNSGENATNSAVGSNAPESKSTFSFDLYSQESQYKTG